MLKFIQECRDANEIIAFFKLLGKTLTKEDAYNLKQNYNSFKTEFNNKNKLTLDQLDKVAGGFVIIKFNIFHKDKIAGIKYVLKRGCIIQDQDLPKNGCEDKFNKYKDSSLIPILQAKVSLDVKGNLVSDSRHYEQTAFISTSSKEALSFIPEHIIQGLICCKSSSENPLSAYDLAQQDQIRKTFTYQNQSLKNKFISLFTEPAAKQSQTPPIQYIESR